VSFPGRLLTSIPYSIVSLDAKTLIFPVNAGPTCTPRESQEAGKESTTSRSVYVEGLNDKFCVFDFFAVT